MMESLSEETWDTVICGTGLSQSLLALALSRSKKRILHLDANDFYGENEAALSLQEADSWAHDHAESQPSNTLALSENDAGETVAERVDEGKQATPPTSSGIRSSIFRNVQVWRHPDADGRGLSFPRAYSLALAPQIIHSKSKLLSQLVSSKAYKQVEFLAVGSFFVYGDADAASSTTLARIPSSREDVFSARSIPARSKRALMKFLKFVIDYESDEQKPIWQPQADKPLSEFLAEDFKLDKNLRDSILAMTLTLDGHITVKDGLATIHRHLTSIGLFGPGFCAVYPKWGGISEIAQVGCRAGAVGGSTYMLNTAASMGEPNGSGEITLTLANEVSIRTTAFITSQQNCSATSYTVSRLVAVINATFQSLFETSTEGAPTPAVVVVAFPSGSLLDDVQAESTVPIYAFVHSSDTGECPAGQSVIYLTMQTTPQSSHLLDAALTALLQNETTTADVLYKLYYEQAATSRQPLATPQGSATVFEFPSPSLSLAFDDGSLDAVQEAWKLIMKDEGIDDAFMQFEDREGVDDDDDVYD
ncbi:rab protein geranylgeranyltransferase component A [Xylaria bambusicola]|uniref:rab protein geranylgeranyltransferase component A n=1 Tax=Xylaria bambusicola TaxID=326684 RepID=UPI002008B340|nr:rab protein geranylgeranyltransferase component A [Xylaria bambusicola]KAI0521095.1 rab protein geranylgeranyltransferase component A [Xylaria bambusicola]